LAKKLSLDIINHHINDHIKTISLLDDDAKNRILYLSTIIVSALAEGNTIFWCGNGGSASDSQHLAGELVGRFIGDRKPLKSIALNADTSVMTCIVNDYGYDYIFSRQVEALGSKGDVLIGITTSGNSGNILKAFEVANNLKMTTIGLLGKGGGEAKNISQHSLIINSQSTARIQEAHITVGHILCDLIELGLNLK
tara:strand:- start:437 stop:1024 length:588 start_codon:yes stop_codon:yes gene_type:complete